MKRLPATSLRLYSLARSESLLAGSLARRGSGITANEAEAESLAAGSTLKRAIEAGFRDLAHMKADRDLDPIRSGRDFQVLLMDLAFPDRSFSP